MANRMVYKKKRLSDEKDTKSNIKKHQNTKKSSSQKQKLEYYENQIAVLDRKIFEMRSLLQSGKGLSNILDLKTLLDAFMSTVRENYGIINSAVFLKDDLNIGMDYYRIRAFFGLKPTYMSKAGIEETLYMFKFPRNLGLLWQVIEQGSVFSVKDLQEEPRFRVAWEEWELDLLDSCTWCPIMKSGDVLGILTLGPTAEGGQIGESEYSFLEEFASIAATNIDSTLKYEKNTRILNNIKTLYDINQQLSQVNDFKKLCLQTLSKAVMAIGAEKGNLMLLNPATNKLELKVVWGPNIPEQEINDINDGIIPTKSFEIGEGIAGQCAKSREPIRINDVDRLPQLGKYPAFCMCSVPVIYADELKGVINMTNKVEKNKEGRLVLNQLLRYTEEDMALLQGLADQSAQALQKSKLYTESITDRLTGMFNKRHFDDVINEESLKAKESGNYIVLAVMDIDHFKRLNDNFGHQAGDFILQKVADLLTRPIEMNLKGQSFRYGGEEFCLIMPEMDPLLAGEYVEDFRKKVESAIFSFNGKKIKITVSIGMAFFNMDTTHVVKLFDLADKALYKSKETGRNQVRAWMNGNLIRVDNHFKKINLKKYYKSHKQKENTATVNH